MLERVGMRVLERERYIWRRRDGEAVVHIATAVGHEDVEPLLDGEDSCVLADHRDFAVYPYHIRSERGGCLVLLSIREKGADVAYYEALYVAAPEIFASTAQAFANAILPEGPAVLAVDKRFLGDFPVDAEAEAFPVPRYFRPAPDLMPSAIDFLYCEIELLNLKLW